jgi:hypothetical protein
MNRTSRRDARSVSPSIARLDRRIWALAISVVYVVIGMAYEFRWGPIVRHVPSSWIAPGDLLSDYGTAIQFAQGHFSNVYAPGRGFLSYPGLLVALYPLAAINNIFHGLWVNIKVNNVLVPHPEVLIAPHLPSGFWYEGNFGPTTTHGVEQVIQASAYPYLIFLTLAYSCFALFACDALAERLQVDRSRRAVLAIAEAVVLWNVTILFGHPEDAVAVGFAIYALIFAFDERFVGAAWLFGLALAFQPLAIVTLPILLVMAGRSRALGMAVRGAVPAAVVTAAPLIASIHNTFHALIDQPTFPEVSSAHRTPWTFLAPKLGGTGKGTTVGGGLPRTAVLALAAFFGWWARRWREKPEMMAWALAAVLAIRVYFETVMYSYYVWPVLAVALAVAARGSRRRFGIAVTLAVLTTIIGQWHMPWAEWWLIDVAGITGLLVAASRPEPLVASVRPRTQSDRSGRAGRSGRSSGARAYQGGPDRSQQAKPAAKKTAPARGRQPAVAQGRTKSAKAPTRTQGSNAQTKRPADAAKKRGSTGR